MRLFILICAIGLSVSAFAQKKKNPLRGLRNLNPYEDVAVLQRKFLPKTDRWEFWTAGSFLMNDPYFLNIGITARLAYSWAEQHAFELNLFDIAPSKRKITDDLENREGDVQVVTSTLISPEAYFGLSYRWSPIYGKMSPFAVGITPFDMYFSLGGGMTMTNKGGSEATLHLGAGQIFAIDKNTAFRWDFSYMFLNAVAEKKDFAGNVLERSESTFSNLYLNLGVSFFFPEATYR